MRRTRVWWVAGFVLIVVAVASAVPIRYATEAEAQAMLQKAVSLFQKEGAGAIADIGRSEGPFFHDDLYVFVIGPDQKVVANPAEPALVGTDSSALRDPHGKPYGLLITRQATEDGVTVDYESKNPRTHRIEDKATIVVRSGGYIFACGYYLPPPESAQASGAETAPKKESQSWSGRWSATEEDGTHFVITLDAAGHAVSERGEGQRGFWIVDQDHVRVDWTDGWTDYLIPGEAGFERISFAPGARRDETPSSTTPITKEK